MGVEPMERATASTEKILANLSRDQLDLATPCQSWTVRDVINHIAGNGYWFEGIARDGVAPDRPDNAAPDVTGGDFLANYSDGSRRAIAAFAADGVLDSTLNLPWGEMPAAAFLLMASTDQFVHGWDIAKATGQSTDLDEDLAAVFLEFYSQVPVDSFRGPDGEGAPFGALVTVPASAGPLAQLLALLGRTP
jgi:uncharacterized protein (TIGR03086 family)